MAQRRMFSKQIVSTDAFMEMPVSTQLLYFHLSMEADDDGFVSSPRRILKNINCGEIDYKLLIAKRFIIPFENGICVIKHWLIHNYIQKDRYTPTTYVDEKNLLEIKENGVYTECIQDVSSLETQVSIGKVSKGEVRLDKDIKESYGEFKNVSLKMDDWVSLRVKFGESNADILIQELSSYMASKGKRYINHYATLLNWGRRKIETHNDKLSPKKRTIV